VSEVAVNAPPPGLLRDLITLTKPRIISLLLVTTVCAMFAAQQKLLEQNIATWHNKEQQTARSLDMCAERFEESADRGISRLEGVCAALHTATKEHQVAAMKAQHWFNRVTLGTQAWPLVACTLGGAMAAIILQYFLTRI
jgi:hypothetical protein